MTHQEISFKPIGIISSCFKQKFGIPRQPGLAPSATATLTFFPPYNRKELFEGIDAFSHIWVYFIFHSTQHEGWRPTVRPPRLGGKERRGVFATRATHRPNPLGSSVVKVDQVEVTRSHGIKLHLSGIDFLDQTPVVDIKPYLPYSDKVDAATENFLTIPQITMSVTFSHEAVEFCRRYSNEAGKELVTLISQVLQQDPRPGYLRKNSDTVYWIHLWDLNVGWKVNDFCITVLDIQYSTGSNKLG